MKATAEYIVEVNPNMNCKDDAPGGFFSSKEAAINYINLNKQYFISATINGEEVCLKPTKTKKARKFVASEIVTYSQSKTTKTV